MHKRTIPFFISALFFFSLKSIFAQTVYDPNLAKEVSRINQEAQSPTGQRVVRGSLKDYFKVTDNQIEILRHRNFSYGEIGIIFSLAQHMDGGINAENIQKIIALHQLERTRDWSKTARHVGLSISYAQQELKKLNIPSPSNGERNK